MTDTELLAKLVDEGCLVMSEGGLLDVGFAGIEDGACWFVPYFPEDQHHLHCIPYTRSQQFYDRDLAFYDANEVMVLYFAPYIEWPELDVGVYLESRDRWLEEMNTPERHQAMADFVFSVLRVRV